MANLNNQRNQNRQIQTLQVGIGDQRSAKHGTSNLLESNSLCCFFVFSIFTSATLKVPELAHLKIDLSDIRIFANKSANANHSCQGILLVLLEPLCGCWSKIKSLPSGK